MKIPTNISKGIRILQP